MHRDVLIVGASLAAVNAAEALRDHGFPGSIALLGEELHAPYSRPPLSKEGLLGMPLADTALKSPGWYADQAVDLLLGARAVALDGRRRLVRTEAGAELSYGSLLVTTGSSARRPPGRPNPYVHTLRTRDDCVALREALLETRSVVVVGGGFLGMEVASIASQMGIACTLVEALPHLLSVPFGDEMGDWFSHVHRSQGVTVRCGVPVVDVEGGPGRFLVRLADGGLLHAELVVAAVGSHPAVGWLAGSGIAVGDGVLCDGLGRASLPGVYAAGDVSRSYNELYDQQLRIEHWTSAVERGRAVALAAMGADETPYRAVPYFWSQQYAHLIHFVGHAFAASGSLLRRVDDRTSVAIYERGGRLAAALCVNAPQAAARLRTHIADRLAWADAVSELGTLRPQRPSIG